MKAALNVVRVLTGLCTWCTISAFMLFPYTWEVVDVGDTQGTTE